MFRNYFKTAWRNLAKKKLFSAINITGLTIGLTCCFLIALYILHELSFDKFQQKGDRIARVVMEFSFKGGNESIKGAFSSVRVAAVFPKLFPEIESAVKMAQYDRVIKYEDEFFDEKKVMFADSTFFDIFSFKLLQGNIHDALATPHSIVLTESASKKYFGNNNPVGKVLHVGNDSNLYRISGVMQDCPSNSQIQTDFIASFSSLGLSREYENSYSDANYVTYFLLKDKNSLQPLQDKISAYMKKEMEGKSAIISLFLEPFEKIHLYSPYDSFVPNSNISYIYILAAVALLILIIACFTYINLSTARSLERAKEVGVRKLIGAEKKQLFWQFIYESILLCLVAVVLSLILSALLLPLFNRLVDKELGLSQLFSFSFIAFSIAIALGLSFAAGIYPAFVFTRFQPIKVLKGAFKNTASGQLLRKSLIVFQFCISVFLIISTFVIQRQLHFIQNKKLGYDRQHVLVLPLDTEMMTDLDAIKQVFKTNSNVLSVSRCVRSPVEGGGGYNMRSPSMPGNLEMNVTANPVDEDFVKTVGLQLIAGSDFTQQDIKDASHIGNWDKNIYHFILNESAAKQLGWSPQEAVNQKMSMGPREGYVRGVIKDFNFESLHSPIKPFVLFTEMRGRELLVKLNGQHLSQTISFLQSKWKELVAHRPFEFHFLDEDYDKLYQSEIRLSKVMNIFTIIGTALACFGLFGLSSYVMQLRIKEIGIRKVLGASVSNITTLLAKDFILLVLVAFIIAMPLSWFVMSKWLQDYTYRISIGWEIFLIATAISLLITLITVSFQAIKAAVINPVKSLRRE
ncbi:MAG: ABC transporter permease [Chitinophagaceae bacterium]